MKRVSQESPAFEQVRVVSAFPLREGGELPSGPPYCPHEPGLWMGSGEMLCQKGLGELSLDL